MKKESKETKQAVALRYDGERHSAPRIVAGGGGNIAEKILQVAREYQVPIEDNSELVEMLSFFDVGQEIPEEAYRAVAEILAFIYAVEKGYKR